MKKAIHVTSIIGVIIFFLLATPAISAAIYDSVVTGKGDANQDVKAVQDAVNQGGRCF